MSSTREEKRKKLIELRKEALENDDLPLREGATNLVFGEGDVEAEILFIGEGPGHWEDVKARPFVGNAGAFRFESKSDLTPALHRAAHRGLVRGIGKKQ